MSLLRNLNRALTATTGLQVRRAAPVAPALHLPTQDQTPDESAAAVYALLAERGLVGS